MSLNRFIHVYFLIVLCQNTVSCHHIYPFLLQIILGTPLSHFNLYIHLNTKSYILLSISLFTPPFRYTYIHTYMNNVSDCTGPWFLWGLLFVWMSSRGPKKLWLEVVFRESEQYFYWRRFWLRHFHFLLGPCTKHDLSFGHNFLTHPVQFPSIPFELPREKPV